MTSVTGRPVSQTRGPWGRRVPPLPGCVATSAGIFLPLRCSVVLTFYHPAKGKRGQGGYARQVAASSGRERPPGRDRDDVDVGAVAGAGERLQVEAARGGQPVRPKLARGGEVVADPPVGRKRAGVVGVGAVEDAVG